MHMTQLLTRRLGEVDTETLPIKEGATQGDNLYMVLYGLGLSVMV